MKRTLVGIILVLSFLILSLSGAAFVVHAQNSIDEEIEQKEEEKQQKEDELELSKQHQYLYEQEGLSVAEKAAVIQTDLQQLQDQISQEETELAARSDKVDTRMEVVESKKILLGDASKSLYKFSRISVIEICLSSGGISDVVQHMGLRRSGIEHLLGQVRDFQKELEEAAGEYNTLSREITLLEKDIESLRGEVQQLEDQRIMYEQMAAAEYEKQQQLAGQIANITAEQIQLIQEKMAATQESTTVGEYGDVQTNLPEPPFSPAYAAMSIGYPHRIGLSQYGAYGRAKAGQTYDQIIAAYFNADLTRSYPEPDLINVDGYGWIPFEDQYLKGIAEMPTYWAQSGGYEALKAQAVLARSYALSYTNNGIGQICTDQHCQVYYHPKVSDPVAAEWHRAVAETRGEVLTYGGVPVKAFYASTAGGYTRLPGDFDVWGSRGTNLPYLKRVVDTDASGKAYDGPSYGNSPWYYKSWYAPSDGHPWLTDAEMMDFLNAAMLPDTYNPYLSHPDLGGWSHEQVRSALAGIDITPIDAISSITVLNNGEGYTSTIYILTPSGGREVNGWRFNNVYNLRSRGKLVLWSSLFDIVVR